MEGAASIDEYLDQRGQPAYGYIIYSNLGDLYLEKERFVDAAEAYEAFVEQDPFHPKSPILQVEVIEAYKLGGFPSLVLEGKKGYVERYGMDGGFWLRNPREENAAVEAHLKANLNDLAQYYHCRGAADGRTLRLPGGGTWYRKYLAYFPGEPDTANTNFLLAEVLFESEQFEDATIEYERTAYELSFARAARPRRLMQRYWPIASTKKHLTGSHERQWHQRYLDSGLKFADTFPEHPESGAVLTTVAEDLFAQQRV